LGRIWIKIWFKLFVLRFDFDLKPIILLMNLRKMV
jgi:hypothetical protein